MKPRFVDSFLYAAQGIRTAVREERNMRFHLCAAFYVYLFSLFYGFGKTEYILITLMVCGVLALELVNSSLERTVEAPRAGPVHDCGRGERHGRRARCWYSASGARCAALSCSGISRRSGACSLSLRQGRCWRCCWPRLLPWRGSHFWKTEGRQIIAAGTDKIDLRGHRGPPQCGEIVSFEQNGGGKGGHRHRKTPDDTNAHHGYIDARCGAVCISGHAGASTAHAPGWASAWQKQRQDSVAEVDAVGNAV